MLVRNASDVFKDGHKRYAVTTLREIQIEMHVWGKVGDLWSYLNPKLLTSKDVPESTQKTGKHPGSVKSLIKYTLQLEPTAGTHSWMNG